MTSLPQFSVERNSQPQFDLIRRFTAQAFANAQRVMTLNISASQASFERSTNTIKQMLTLRDPRDLLALSAHGEQAFHSMLAYSRELFGIVAGSSLAVPATSPAAAKSAAPTPSVATVEDAIAAQVTQASEAPVVVAEPAPSAVPAVAEPNPVAKVLSELAPMPAAAEHPAAAPLEAKQEVELLPVKPVHAAAPAAPVAGTRPAKGKRAAPAKGARKK